MPLHRVSIFTDYEYSTEPSGAAELWISPTGVGVPSDVGSDWVFFGSSTAWVNDSMEYYVLFTAGVLDIGKYAIGRFTTGGQSSDWSVKKVITV